MTLRDPTSLGYTEAREVGMDTPVYAHSGKVGLGPVLVPAIGLPAALLFALVYAYVDAYSPIAGWVSILFVVGFAVALGFTLSFIGSLAKVRSAGFMMSAGLLIGLFALYASWAAFEVAILNKGENAIEGAPGYLELLAEPGTVWRIASLINETGWYTIKSATPSGAVLWIFWAIEAAIVVGGAALISTAGIADEVFCEPCNRWCADSAKKPSLGIPQEEAALEALKHGDAATIAELEKLPRSASGEPVHLLVELKRCDGCSNTATFQLKVVTRGVDKEGKPTTETAAITPQYLVEPDDYRRLEALVASA
jgi:hypothetical protein